MIAHDFTVFLDTLIISMIPLIPIAALAVKNYLQIRTNTQRLDNRPTHDEVRSQIDSKIKELDGTINAQEGQQP